MSVLFLLLPLALLLAAIAVAVFVWAARTGQFDDLETPAIRILHDDPPRALPVDDESSPLHEQRGRATGERTAAIPAQSPPEADSSTG